MLRHGMRNSFCPSWVTRLRSRRSRGEPQGGRLVFAYGTATVVPGSERLTLVRPPTTRNHWLGYKTSSAAIWSGSGLVGQLSSNGGPTQSDDAWVPRHASSSFALNRAGAPMHTA